MKPETRFKLRIMPLLRKIPGSWWVKIQQITIRGTPDIIGCVRGTMVVLELKKGKDEVPQPLQVYNIHAAKLAGAYAEVLYPENWAEIYRDLSQL